MAVELGERHKRDFGKGWRNLAVLSQLLRSSEKKLFSLFAYCSSSNAAGWEEFMVKQKWERNEFCWFHNRKTEILLTSFHSITMRNSENYRSFSTDTRQKEKFKRKGRIYGWDGGFTAGPLPKFSYDDSLTLRSVKWGSGYNTDVVVRRQTFVTLSWQAPV